MLFGDHPDDWTDKHEIPISMWTALQVFLAISNQWRSTEGVPYALDYNVIPFAMEMHGVAEEDRIEIYQDVRTMERAALNRMRLKMPKPA